MGMYWDKEHTSTLECSIRNGKMGIITRKEKWSNSVPFADDPVYTFSATSNMFDIGWNFM